MSCGQSMRILIMEDDAGQARLAQRTLERAGYAVTVVARVLHQQRLIEEKRQAEVALQETLATLEERVRVRTADLQRANAQLRVEIIERRRAEEALTRLSRQHQLILEAAGEGIYGVDRQGKGTFINPAAAQMLGWGVEALIR